MITFLARFSCPPLTAHITACRRCVCSQCVIVVLLDRAGAACERCLTGWRAPAMRQRTRLSLVRHHIGRRHHLHRVNCALVRRCAIQPKIVTAIQLPNRRASQMVRIRAAFLERRTDRRRASPTCAPTRTSGPTPPSANNGVPPEIAFAIIGVRTFLRPYVCSYRVFGRTYHSGFRIPAARGTFFRVSS